ncbi:LptF/LptG family permease [Phenylobacterium sp.]|uniref:LptF/LptG family permease n=1 Tax=Phenylobacterium sp. TaxID=1871053 RepID=UPI00286C7902|nr:LptF/LptG family permease [Phenylobacterium sp.]
MAPLSVLAGGLFAFGQLAREQAVTAMRAAGVSTYRMLAMALPAAGAMMLVHFAAAELIAPRTDARLEAWWQASEPGTPADPAPRAFRSGAEIVVAKAGDSAGRRLNEVSIYRRDAEGRLSERIAASHAIYADGAWRLQQPRMVRFTADDALTSTAAELAWATRLRPADVRFLLSPNQAPSAASARRALEGGGSERPDSYYAVRLQRAFAAPIGVLVMLLLAAPVALGNFRTREGAVLSVGALAGGLTFLVADGLLTALGEGASLSPLLAAWSAPVIFAALAGTVLVRMEG